MRTSRVAPLPLAAVLSAAALAGPAAASDAPGPPTWPTNPKPITSSQVVPHLPGPPTWPTDPQPITEYRGAVQPTSDGFDFDFEAGGIAVAVLVAGMAGAVGVRRRRRITRPRTMPLP